MSAATNITKKKLFVYVKWHNYVGMLYEWKLLLRISDKALYKQDDYKLNITMDH